MDKLHDKKVMDPHGFVVSFDNMSIPRQSDAEIIDAGLLSDNLLRITYLALGPPNPIQRCLSCSHQIVPVPL
jgi:hypothetical protein